MFGSDTSVGISCVDQACVSRSFCYRRDSVREITFLLILSLLCLGPVIAQSPNATINGIVLDPSGATIAGAEVVVVNDATGVQYTTKTNGQGIYVVPNLPPGPYRIQVSNSGFKTIIKPDIVIHVQDALAVNFTLPLGAASEVVTVEGGAPLINTENATVSTVVDRQFAENLPMNGRSFQTLIQLTPGVVLTTSSSVEGGQFSVNGQRTVSNYWMVDGVSANISASTTGNPGNGLGGAIGSFSVLGGTNSLVSIDAMQEFRIQTSTYAPEFGRTPGAQISIVTRSGTNRFHGTAFDYLRNDALDANDWFASANGLPKPEERQNDFGGTLGGPIVRDRTFFFFSYEGLRLRLPGVAESEVPDLLARQDAVPTMQPYLNAYPQPNGPEFGNGMASFNASFSNAATLDAYSLRVDHKLSSKLNLFGRYSYSPSELVQRGNSSFSLSTVSRPRITTQTATLGAILAISPAIVNDLRFNYSNVNGYSTFSQDAFGGAVPLSSLPLPSPYGSENAVFGLEFLGAATSAANLEVGSFGRNIQRQINVIDSLSIQRGLHSLKFGVDYRRLSPSYNPSLQPHDGVPAYQQVPVFLNVASAEQGKPLAGIIGVQNNSTFLLHNLGAFVQDTWRIVPRLTLTYGLRWDVDFAPSSVNGPDIAAVSGYDLTNLANLALASPGTPPFKTTYGNVAPRVGAAYQISKSPEWGLVFRGGFGVFYDLASSEAGNLVNGFYPFGASTLIFGGSFPYNSAIAAPPPITPASLASPEAVLYAFDPHLQLPYTLQWNVALEETLGSRQSISVSYVGSTGKRLLQTASISAPNPSFSVADLTGNTASSDYNAVQVQFQRRLSRGLQALASYTLSHSIDDGSVGSVTDFSSTLVPTLNPNANRGPSDFDVRNAFSAGATYDFPAPKAKSLINAVMRGWSAESFVMARSAPPVNVQDSALDQLNGAFTQVRPDITPGIPLYLFGPQYPGGKAINPAAFTPPPTDSNGNPLRQGDLGRNALRGFGATQWDFAVHRAFPIGEALSVQFRAEMFNVLNHPNFAPPVADISNTAQFGRSTQMLGQYLGNGNVGGGGLNSLYQIGGPRSVQFALKVIF